ncbi:MAG: hypothetical protein D6679_12920 [Candidatus Hydrogenedentota bacterium]|nr:MAG: hypothetical protein D6679_12920 [Candidatus Hydrogenedentota bacterium]
MDLVSKILREIQTWPEWILWVLAVFLAGMIGQFGKSLTLAFLAHAKRRIAAKTPTPSSDTTESPRGHTASAPSLRSSVSAPTSPDRKPLSSHKDEYQPREEISSVTSLSSSGPLLSKEELKAAKKAAKTMKKILKKGAKGTRKLF